MRFDHIVVHVDNDPQLLKSLQVTLQEQGYPFDPDSGSRNLDFRVSNINVGDEYIEIVRLFKEDIGSWNPLWVEEYDQGQRGAFCIYLEVEDLAQTAAALKEAGIEIHGPVKLSYPHLMGVLNINAPYSVCYLPNFPGTSLQIGLLQYAKADQRSAFQARLNPNAHKNGINGIRRIEVSLPDMEESLPMLQALFPELAVEKSGWLTLAGNTRLYFCPAEEGELRLRLHTVTSQRKLLGNTFQIENVEVRTTGG